MEFNGTTYDSIGTAYATAFDLVEAPETVTVYDDVDQPYDADAIDVVLDDGEVLVHEAYPERGEGRYVARPTDRVVELVT